MSQPGDGHSAEPPPSPSGAASEAPSERTVEEVVRSQLSDALGGKRGMVEAAVPTATFTVLFLLLDEIRTPLLVSVGMAVALLVVRIVQRSQVQFVVNALVGIGIGAFFAYRALASGGDADDAALAYFLPGIIYNAVYAVGLAFSVLVRAPVVGFLVGSVTGDPTGWRQDPGIVRLCSRLTWLLALPCLVRVIVQTPLWLAGSSGWADPDTMIALLGVSKIVMGWPLQIAALLGMVWVLGRNKTVAA